MSCGEASGDLLASGVVRSLLAADPSLRVVGLGGQRCRDAGMETLWDVSELSVMGIGEVLPKLRHILRLMRTMAETAARLQPVAALLVDAPDFNLRLAPKLRARGVRVVQYVSPTVWAWRQGRAKSLARNVDALCCILPFEAPWLSERNVPASFVGHPLLEHEPSPESITALRRELLQQDHPGGGEGPLLALLPGSRGAEVKLLLPPFLEAAKRLARRHPSLEVVLPVAPTIPRERIEAMCERAGFMPKLVSGRARELLGAADAALVASGTATLEATLARTPMVVAYKVSLLTELIFRLLVRAPFVALPNILAGREIVPERLQRDVRPEVLADLVAPLLSDTPERARMVEALTAVRASLGEPGASTRVADVVLGRELTAARSPVAELPPG